MKSTLAKGALALSVLGFTFGSNVVYDQNSQWQPSIFRTIANAVENAELTAENVVAELDALKEKVAVNKEAQKAFKAKLDAEETGLTELIKMREEEINPLGEEALDLLARSRDFNTFFRDNQEHESKVAYEALAKEMADMHPSPLKEELLQKIETSQEAEILEQKAAIATANERICENKGLLQDIKAQIAELLKDKEEVVAEVDEEEATDDTQDGFSADVLTYADFFAHIGQQQRSFFEVSPPSFLAPTSDPFSMMMMFSIMNRQQNSAPRTQINSYYMGHPGFGFGGHGFPGSRNNDSDLFQEFDSQVLRTPATKPMPALMPTIDGVQYTRVIEPVSKSNGLLQTFNVN